MLKTCIKHPAWLFSITLLLSACAGMSTPPQPEVSPAVSQAYQAALAAMKAGKDKVAISQFKQIASTNPTLAGPHTNLGILYIKADALADAEQALLKAVELNPQSKLAYNYLGIVYRQQGRFDDAEKAYLSAIKIDSNYSYAHLNLGILYDLYKSDLPKALSHYQTYLGLTDKPDKMVEKWILDLKRRDTATSVPEEKKG